MNEGLIERIDDLIEQATKERSHYYSASILKECKFEIQRLRGLCGAFTKAYNGITVKEVEK